MGSKPLWPVFAASMLVHIREYGHILGLYIDITLKLILDRHKPPGESFKSFFQGSSAFIENVKQEPTNHDIFEEIRKAVDAFTRCKTFIEEQIIAIKNSSPISNLLYANVASQGANRKATTGISLSAITTPTPVFNKANEIIIKIHNKVKTVLGRSIRNPPKILYKILTTTYKRKILVTQISVQLKSSKVEI